MTPRNPTRVQHPMLSALSVQTALSAQAAHAAPIQFALGLAARVLDRDRSAPQHGSRSD